MSRSWMPVAALVVCLSPVAATQEAVAPLGADSHAALSALETSGLEQMRAASGQLPAALPVSERAELSQLEARHESLSELRAGEISDDDFKLIMITAAVVVVIALIL